MLIAEHLEAAGRSMRAAMKLFRAGPAGMPPDLADFGIARNVDDMSGRVGRGPDAPFEGERGVIMADMTNETARLGEDPDGYRRYVARWRHLDHQLEEGERLRRRTAKLERDLRTAVPSPPSRPLSLASKCFGHRCYRGNRWRHRR